MIQCYQSVLSFLFGVRVVPQCYNSVVSFGVRVVTQCYGSVVSFLPGVWVVTPCYDSVVSFLSGKSCNTMLLYCGEFSVG